MMSQLASNGEAIRILVVEDNAPDVMLIGEALRERGMAFDLVHMRDGEEALNRLENPLPGDNSFNLIILDLNMPRISGLEVLERLRAQPIFAVVPILVLTSSLAPEEQREASRLGADRYVKKPADLYEFLSQVGTVILELVPGRRSSSDGNG